MTGESRHCLIMDKEKVNEGGCKCLQLPDVDIALDESNATIFKFVQHLATQSTSCGKAERLKRIWEPTYT